MTDIRRLRGQVSARVFASAVDLRTVDVDAITATVAATAGADADVAAIDDDTWSRLLDDHDPAMRDRRVARAAALDHPREP